MSNLFISPVEGKMMIPKTNALYTEEARMVALSVHNALHGIPVAVKVANGSEVLIEDGKYRFHSYECKELNVVFSGAPIRQIHIGEGKYLGATMFASAIIDDLGRRVAAIGVIDEHGTMTLGEFVANDDHIEKQVEYL
jgi:hypothetical protein